MNASVIDPIKRELDEHYELSRELLEYLGKVLGAYERRTDGLDIPLCTRSHLAYLVKEIGAYATELHEVRCALPRLMTNVDDRD